MSLTVQGLSVPDSKLAREITELVRDTASPLLFHHSSRVYYFGVLAGKRRNQGIKRKPDTTFGNVKADVLADKDPTFKRGNFCSVIRRSAWSA